jgi:hypothetical protein
MKEWMGADLSGLDIMAVQIDGIHISEHLVLVAALGIDSEGFKHPLGLMEGDSQREALECRPRWPCAGLLRPHARSQEGLSRLNIKAFRQLPALTSRACCHYEKKTNNHAVSLKAKAA